MGKIHKTRLTYFGYEAYISLIKWCLPLDEDLIFKELLNTLSNQITIEALSTLQTQEQIILQTRHKKLTGAYPFDNEIFHPENKEQKES